MITLERVIPKNLVNQLQLQKFQVAQIESKHANKAVQLLKGLQTLPIDFFFLKRVRRIKSPIEHSVQILLCLTDQKDRFIQQISEQFAVSFQQNIIKQMLTIELPRFAPASKKDFEEWAKYWPCNFIEPQFAKAKDHSKEESMLIKELYKAAKGKKQNICSFYFFTSEKYLAHFQGLKEEFSCQNKNPLEHPVMKIMELWPSTEAFKSSEKEFYYMTGVKMIVCSSGLCGMCGMALVHSRIERLYFEQDSIPSEEILSILFNPRLNHKIDMLKIKEVTEKQEQKN